MILLRWHNNKVKTTNPNYIRKSKTSASQNPLFHHDRRREYNPFCQQCRYYWLRQIQYGRVDPMGWCLGQWLVVLQLQSKIKCQRNLFYVLDECSFFYLEYEFILEPGWPKCIFFYFGLQFFWQYSFRGKLCCCLLYNVSVRLAAINIIEVFISFFVYIVFRKQKCRSNV